MEVLILCGCTAVLLGIVNYFSLVRPRVGNDADRPREAAREAWWAAGGSALHVAGCPDRHLDASTRRHVEVDGWGGRAGHTGRSPMVSDEPASPGLCERS